MSRRLETVTWPSIARQPLVLVPMGSIEQHGPHLPLDTEAVIAEAVAQSAAERLGGGEMVAPAIRYAASGEHQMFPGTCSIGSPVLHQLLVELVRSMRTWAGRVVFVNAHGGNVEALTGAVVQLRDEGHDVGWIPCATELVDLHAGFTETSLMLHLRPEAVRMEAAEAGNTAPLRELLPVLMSGGVGAVSPNGVLGDPAGATAAEGQRCLETMVADVARRVHGSPDARGMLGGMAGSAPGSSG